MKKSGYALLLFALAGCKVSLSDLGPSGTPTPTATPNVVESGTPCPMISCPAPPPGCTYPHPVYVGSCMTSCGSPVCVTDPEVVVPPAGIYNAALGKPAVSFTDKDAAHPASAAVDGDLASYWGSAYTFTEGQYVEVDLQNFHSISSADVHTGWSPSAAGESKFELQYEAGGCWKQIPGATVANNTLSAKNIAFSNAVVTRRVRYVCKDSATYCYLRELKINGVAAAAPTSAPSCPIGTSVHRHPGYDSALFLPANYNQDRTTLFPIILSLHGVGGDTLKDDRSGVLASPEGQIRYAISHASSFPAIVLAPQQNSAYTGAGNGWFNDDILTRMLQTVQREFRVDTDRIYVTGLSGGGNSTIGIGHAMSSQLAALLPVAVAASPGTDLTNCVMKNLPIWAACGTADNIGHCGHMDDFKNTMDNKCGAPLGISATHAQTKYEGAGHGSDTWDRFYADPLVYEWLFQQRRRP